MKRLLQLQDGCAGPYGRLYVTRPHRDGLTGARAAWADEGGTMAHPWPVIADSQGAWPAVWLEGDVGLELTYSNENPIWLTDDIEKTPAPPARFDDLAAAVQSARLQGKYEAALTVILEGYRSVRKDALPHQIRCGLLAAGFIAESE